MNIQQYITNINSTPIKRNFTENLPHNQKLKQLAKDKRKEDILSEVLFWQQVHKNNFFLMIFYTTPTTKNKKPSQVADL